MIIEQIVITSSRLEIAYTGTRLAEHELLGRMVVETFACLSAKPPSIDILDQQWARTALRFSQTIMQHPHNGEASAKLDKNYQLKRTHRHVYIRSQLYHLQ